MTELERLALVRRTVEAFTSAMATEGIDARSAERVVNRVMHGHPDGIDAVMRPADVNARIDWES